MLIAMSLLASTHGEGPARELLIGIKDVRLAVTSRCILQRRDAECRMTARDGSPMPAGLIEQQDSVRLASPWWRSQKTPNGVLSDGQRAT